MHGTYSVKILSNCPAVLIVCRTSLKLRKHVPPKRLCICRLIPPDYVTLHHFLDDSSVNFNAFNIFKILYLLVQSEYGLLYSQHIIRQCYKLLQLIRICVNGGSYCYYESNVSYLSS
jgi:hypothetical protein